MIVQRGQPFKIRSDSQSARIDVHPNGQQSVTGSIVKDPAFLGGSFIFVTTNEVAGMTHHQITDMLNNRFAAFRPDNGYDNLAETIHKLASDPRIQHIVVAFAAGAVSYPFLKAIFEKLGIKSSQKFAMWASYVVVAALLILLSIYASSPLTKDQCGQGYSAYKGDLKEVAFKAQCSELLGTEIKP